MELFCHSVGCSEHAVCSLLSLGGLGSFSILLLQSQPWKVTSLKNGTWGHFAKNCSKNTCNDVPKKQFVALIILVLINGINLSNIGEKLEFFKTLNTIVLIYLGGDTH